MIKRITLTLILSFFIFSCGKKGDPEYKEPENNAKIQVFLTDKV
tara:strand:+ start:446 stop:577 length:132 start_codon:yes stop_codon:yes gene_type:complete